MTQKALIIIPCLNEEEHIHKLLNKLIEDTEDIDAKIVVADGGSTDKTVSLIKTLQQEHENIILLNNPKRIQSAAINLAVQTCGEDYDYFIRMDAHGEYPQGFCETLLEEAKTTGADSVVIAVDTVGLEGFQIGVAAAQNSKLGNGGSAHRSAGEEGMWIEHGHHALFRTEAFKAVEGYDETFTHNEDAELDARLAKAGYKIWLTGKTFSTYYPRKTPQSLFRQYYNYGRGRGRTILKHQMKPKLRQMIPVGVAPAVALLILSPIIGIAALPAEIWALACLGYGAYLAFKEENPYIAWAGPAAMIMHLAWSLGFWRTILEHIKENRG